MTVTQDDLIVDLSRSLASITKNAHLVIMRNLDDAKSFTAHNVTEDVRELMGPDSDVPHPFVRAFVHGFMGEVLRFSDSFEVRDETFANGDTARLYTPTTSHPDFVPSPTAVATARNAIKATKAKTQKGKVLSRTTRDRIYIPREDIPTTQQTLWLAVRNHGNPGGVLLTAPPKNGVWVRTFDVGTRRGVRLTRNELKSIGITTDDVRIRESDGNSDTLLILPHP